MPVAGFVLAIVLFVATASAGAPVIDGLGRPLSYGTNCLGPNDDGSSAPIDLTPAFPRV